MSGGTDNYAYRQVEMVAERLKAQRNTTPLRKAFAEHLELVAVAMHDLEWVDSQDSSPGDEEAAIRRVIDRPTELHAALDLAEERHRGFQATIAEAEKVIAEVQTSIANEYKKRFDQALAVIKGYDRIESQSHKAWVIDQVVRILTGPDYTKWMHEKNIAP